MPKYTKEDVAEICEREGTGYAAQNYLDINNIEDSHLRDLVIAVRIALDNLEEELNL